MDSEVLSIYENKTVLITGNTGFKGSWMSMWLLEIGAKVYGYSLDPPTSPSLYHQLNLEDKMTHCHGDVRDAEKLKKYIQKVKPDFIFHLAAQPLVRESYDIPVETMEVNVMGTAYLLEAVRQLNINTVVVCITTDKCYENKEWVYGYRESEAMGGYDPYSASKGAAELVISSYRNSFFNTRDYLEHGVKLASTRAGNVIGGGDWANDRIVPDSIRALQDGQSIFVRNPKATRPWQHVLEPLGGYLLLGAKLFHCENPNELKKLCSGFNFGPSLTSNKNVQTLVEEILKHWDGNWHHENIDAVHEASLLHLSIEKAYHFLNWTPVWDFEDTIKETVVWYKSCYEDPEMVEAITLSQIKAYSQKAETMILQN